MSKTIVVAGYGPGISDAVARRFGREKYAVALVGRTRERLNAGVKSLAESGIEARAFPADVGDVDAVRTLVREASRALGPIAALHWNAYIRKGGDLTVAPDELRAVLDVGVHGLLAAVQEALPDLKQQRGAVLVTGGGLALYDSQTDARAVAWGAQGLAVSKAAQHKLVGLLHHKLKPDGIYVGEVTVESIVKGTAFDDGKATLEATTIADAFWDLTQKRSDIYVNLR